MSASRKKWNVNEKFSTGFEMEMFTLDREGNVVNGGSRIISQVKKEFRDAYVVKEVGMHMLEIGSKPSGDLRKAFNGLLVSADAAWKVAQKNKLLLYGMATYPGSFTPKIGESLWYEFQKRIMGEDKFRMGGLCSGFHFHFSLPSNLVRKDRQNILAAKEVGTNDSFVSSYNFLIAADPAVTTLMQSSPYIQGNFLAKDSRMLFYRGGENLGYQGIYHDYQIFGGLQDYIHTITDVVKLIEKRYDIFKSQLIHWGFDPALISKYSRRMDVAWNPVKVNKHNTFEQRGMDMNLPSYALGVSALLHFSLKRIVEEKIEVTPSDTGIYKPFTLEGSRLYVPPISTVQEKLQYLSATEGLSNGKILRYCKYLYAFASAKLPREDKKLLGQVYRAIKERKTMSDRQIAEIRAIGITDPQKEIKKKQAAKLAEKWAYDFLDDIDYAKKLLS